MHCVYIAAFGHGAGIAHNACLRYPLRPACRLNNEDVSLALVRIVLVIKAVFLLRRLP